MALARNKPVLLDFFSNKIEFSHSISHKSRISQLKVQEAQLPEQKMANRVLVKFRMK